MNNKIKLIFMIAAIITLQADESHSKTLKNSNITLEIISLKEWKKGYRHHA